MQMMASGASFHFGHLYGNNPDELRAQLTRNMRDAKIVAGPAMVPNLMRGGWAKWNDLNNVTENLNRAAIYQQNQDKGGLRAAFESRDLIDFSAHGAWPAVRILIDIVPFLNARIQGLDKIYRSGMKPGASVLAKAFGKGEASVTDKQAAARFWTVTGAVTAATIALYLHNQNDEEYQKLEEWQKDTYWFFRVGNQAFFIPKPFEVGAIATQAERITEQFTDNKATGALFRQRLMHMMTDTFSFSPVPQMMQPALDIYANYDAFTGRPIGGMGMDRLSPELRRRSSTSKAGEWISAGLNKTLGAIGNPDQNPFALSPVQVDHLIGGYLGQVGTWAASSGDIAWRVASGEENPARRWYEYQPVRRFYRNLGDEDRYTKYGTIFYDGLREANRAYADAKELREMGRLADASELATSKRELLALRQPLNRAQRRLSTINQRIDLVRRSNPDAEVKRQRIDRLSAVKNQLQRALGERLQVMKAG
ncbi:LPD38 domain-containing protein [Vreelandella sp. EE27]